MSFMFRDIDLPVSKKLCELQSGEKMQKCFALDYRKVPFKNRYKPPHCVVPD